MEWVNYDIIKTTKTRTNDSFIKININNLKIKNQYLISIRENSEATKISVKAYNAV